MPGISVPPRDEAVSPVATHRRLPADRWAALADAHACRADELTAAYRARRAAGQQHAVEDFLFTYYPTRPSALRRWHPGAGVTLAPGPEGPAPHAGWRWYGAARDGGVALDARAYLHDRGDTVAFVHRLLTATAARPPFTGCFGLHEWAMVYRDGEHRHPLPLRLGQSGTDAVVDSHPVRCSHFDAYRFFTPAARPLNTVRPTREGQATQEQPGCLHATMDLYKWSCKLTPLLPSELVLDCFRLAREARELDMRASPYDLADLGYPPVRVETPEGRAQYVREQRGLAERGQVLRAALLARLGRLDVAVGNG